MDLEERVRHLEEVVEQQNAILRQLFAIGIKRLEGDPFKKQSPARQPANVSPLEPGYSNSLLTGRKVR